MTTSSRVARTMVRGESGDDLRRLQESTGVEVLAELGQGSHTVVYHVRRGGVEYAMKVMRRTGDGDSLAAFRREASLLACVDHPGLARVREVGAVEDRPYLVMDLVRGERLTEALAGGPLAADRVVAIGMAVAGALTAAHGAGLVHRDVKPDNILIPPDGSARLIDFGLATRAAQEHADVVAGTLVYTAPEQSGLLNRPVDGRADLYALGVVMFECATGSPPFFSADVGELMRMHAATPAPDVRVARPDLPPALGAIIATLLAKDPDDRYCSGVGLIADLARLADERDFALRTQDEPVGSRHDLPLVGRGAELASLTTRWEQAVAGRGGVVVVQGPPGSGKSRLAREVSTVARRSGQVVLTARCVPDEPMPLAPIRAAVEEYVLSTDRLPEPGRSAARRGLVAAAGSAAPLLKNLSPALGALLAGADLGEDDRHDQFVAAVAAFLVELGRGAGGAVLHVDDAHWLDEATRRVLAQVADDLNDSPVLLLLGFRADIADGPPEADAGLPEADAGLPETDPAGAGLEADTVVTLESFDAAAVADLLAVMSGGMTVDIDGATYLAARTAGNPLALQEYINAAMDAGLIRPDWGVWQFDVDGLDALDLPGNTAELVLRRLEALDATSRQILGTAAALGLRFDPALVAEVCTLSHQQAQDVVARAAWQRLVERREGGGYAFVHHRIPEALLSQLDSVALSRLHERIADVLDSRDGTDDESAYALARHCQLAGVDRDPERVFRTGLVAGRLALADHAPAQAIGFLEAAAEAAAGAGHVDDYGFLLTLGTAYHHDGRFRDAVATLHRALSVASTGYDRAVVLYSIARVHGSTWDTAEEVVAIEQGLAELNRPLPKNAILVVLTTVLPMLVGYLVGLTRLGYGTVRGAKRDFFCLLASLQDAAAAAYARELRPVTAAVFLLRQLYLVNRLGPGPELVRAKVGLAYLLSRAGLRRTADRRFRRGVRMATELQDSRLTAYIMWLRGMGLHSSGADEGTELRRTLSDHGRWLDPGRYIDSLSVLLWDALLVGDSAEIGVYRERRRAKVAASGQFNRNANYAADAGDLARRGRVGEAAACLKRIREATPVQPRWERVDTLIATLIAAVEQNDIGAGFEEAVADFRSLQVGPFSLLNSHDSLYVYIACVRLEQCRRATDEELPARLHEARRAVRAVRLAARRPLMRAYHRVLTAALLQVRGRDRAALTRLARVDPIQLRTDAPLLAFETALIRARALRALGIRGEAGIQARVAMMIATDQEWPHRVRQCMDEFDVRNIMVTHTHTYTRSGDPRGGGVRRERLDALEQVSIAASRTLDPEMLTRIALDETIRILFADRAFLFLLDGDPPALVPHIGRDAEGNDLHEPTAYGATLVERVRHSQEPIVVTGSEQGEALGSQSVVLHGLRSIMVAPLQLEGRLLGVVYLDSRMAKGIFTVDDVGILTAITNHVAVALETARAAQLEVAVTTARRERDLAETMREAMNDIGGTLEPAEVMHRLAATVSRVLQSDRALVVTDALETRDDDTVVRVPADDPRLRCLLDPATPVFGSGEADRPAILQDTFDAAASWIVVPLITGVDRVGALVVVSRQAGAYSQTQAGIAAALVGQGMVAYEKAKLFTQVERLATTDGLTGMMNRRHFFELATRELASAEFRPRLAMMLDIDHFKRVNDVHGHQVGDEVIREVASRLQRFGRDDDLFGRYGGEEFAVLLVVDEENAAAVAERLRRAVADVPVETRAGPLSITISVGGAYFDRVGEDIDILLAAADECLYQAKRAGRNKAFLHSRSSSHSGERIEHG